MWSRPSVRAGIQCVVFLIALTGRVAHCSELDSNVNALETESAIPGAKHLDWGGAGGFEPSSYHLKLAWKLSLCLLILFGASVAFLVWKRRSGWTPVPTSRHMRVVETINVGPGITIRLMDVGTQRVLVGHDRQGLKRMVVLHREFDDLMDHQGVVPSEVPAIGGRAHSDHTFSTPKDHGWALNQSIT